MAGGWLTVCWQNLHLPQTVRILYASGQASCFVRQWLTLKWRLWFLDTVFKKDLTVGERRCYSGGMTENGSGILSSVIPELSQGKDPNSFISTTNFPPIHLQVLLVCTLTSQTYNQDVSATIHMLVPQDLLCDPNLSPTFSSGCFLSRPQVSLRSPSCIPTHFLPEVIVKFVLHTTPNFWYWTTALLLQLLLVWVTWCSTSTWHLSPFPRGCLNSVSFKMLRMKVQSPSQRESGSWFSVVAITQECNYVLKDITQNRSTTHF